MAVKFDGATILTQPRQDIANPEGVLLDTVTATIPANASFLDLNNSPSWLSDGNLSGKGECALDPNDDTPSRVYTSLNIEIVKAGHYTFRVVGTNPEFTGDLFSSPIQDAFMALYRGFDPLSLDENVVGCNDDAYSTVDPVWSNGDTFVTTGESNTNDRWPHFEADLTPGTHTVILTTYLPVDASQWAAFAPESATFEYWGPECGISTPACAAPSGESLANTGIDSTSTALFAMGLIALGFGITRTLRRKA